MGDIYFDVHPSCNYIHAVFDQPILIGQDAIVGCEIYDQLNAKPMYYSSSLKSRAKPIEDILIMKQKVKAFIAERKNSGISRTRTIEANYLYLIFDLRKLDNLFISLDVE